VFKLVGFFHCPQGIPAEPTADHVDSKTFPMGDACNRPQLQWRHHRSSDRKNSDDRAVTQPE